MEKKQDRRENKQDIRGTTQNIMGTTQDIMGTTQDRRDTTYEHHEARDPMKGIRYSIHFMERLYQNRTFVNQQT